MEVRLARFGSIEVDGLEFEHDVVIDEGTVRKRKKGPSKQHRAEFRHTPLSAAEDLPWGGRRLIIGTGVYGSLPITADVVAEAAAPTTEACRLISTLDAREVHAVLHVTC